MYLGFQQSCTQKQKQLYLHSLPWHAKWDLSSGGIETSCFILKLLLPLRQKKGRARPLGCHNVRGRMSRQRTKPGGGPALITRYSPCFYGLKSALIASLCTKNILSSQKHLTNVWKNPRKRKKRKKQGRCRISIITGPCEAHTNTHPHTHTLIPNSHEQGARFPRVKLSW